MNTTNLLAVSALTIVLGLPGQVLAFTACQVTDTGGIDDNSFN